MPLTFGSLFAGIGGADLGLERAGMVCKWQVEIDGYATRVLEKHWPDVRRHRDVRTFPQPGFERVDVIVGGFPCQDISYAGKGAGITGERSGLWSEMLRVVRVLRPRFVIVENVAALLGRGMGTVLGDLARNGFDAEWDVLSTRQFGGPHTRERVFIVAYANKKRRNSRKNECCIMPKIFCAKVERLAHWRSTGELVRTSSGRTRLIPGPGIQRMDDGIPNRLDRLGVVGNAISPDTAEWIGRRIIEAVAMEHEPKLKGQHDRRKN